MEKIKNKMILPKLDDIFTTQAERDNLKLEKIENIEITKIDEFYNHPFKVNVDNDMKNMIESIKEKGVLVPVIVRKKDNDKYEMISGHRRLKACFLLSLNKIPCIVRDLTDDEAIITMVDSNLQREEILPSERAFAYKMKLEAINHQGKETNRHNVEKLLSSDLIGKEQGESGRTVQRYIRLTKLVPKLLQMVDDKTIALNPAFEISFLTEDEQLSLLDFIECNLVTPSHSQAIKLKNLSKNKTLTIDAINDIMSENKPNQTPKLKVSMNKLSNILPQNLKNDREKEAYVIKAVGWYDKYQKKLKCKKLQER